MDPKQRAAEAALQYVRNDTVIGLGTGSTADFFLVALAQALRDGCLKNVKGVATSVQSQRRAGELGIELTTLAECPILDVTIDGADEITPRLDLIKGRGGALLREKIIAQNSKRVIIVADSSKRVDVLGTQAPLPVEVTQFAHEAQERFLRSLGCVPALRTNPDRNPMVTDNGNYIYDCRFPGIADPAALQAALSQRAGIAGTGLFLGLASLALIADQMDVQKLARPK
jgi:ribose 5-phosphate isomerase A